jgi:indolepyruvate ferredoxin oxidoreductase beta subunit
MPEGKDILLVGVGGQGTILVSRILTSGLVKAGYDVKMSEVHGMAQRGGNVSTQIRYGEKIYSPIIGRGGADVLVAFEKMEAVRYAEFLRPDGIAIINDYAMVPMSVSVGGAKYPDGVLDVMSGAFKTVSLKAGEIAISLGNARCMNIVLLGAMVEVLGLGGINWNDVMKEIISPKLIELNVKAFESGRVALSAVV